MDTHTIEALILAGGVLVQVGVLVGTLRWISTRLTSLEVTVQKHAELPGHPADHATLTAVAERQDRDGDAAAEMDRKIDKAIDLLGEVRESLARLEGRHP